MEVAKVGLQLLNQVSGFREHEDVNYEVEVNGQKLEVHKSSSTKIKFGNYGPMSSSHTSDADIMKMAAEAVRRGHYKK